MQGPEGRTGSPGLKGDKGSVGEKGTKGESGLSGKWDTICSSAYLLNISVDNTVEKGEHWLLLTNCRIDLGPFL